MLSHKEILQEFVEQFDQIDDFSYVLCGIIGGTAAQDMLSSSSDIDILLISKDDCGDQLYKDLFDLGKNNTQFRKFLDVKIIEKKHISKINSSTSAPFFYHFAQNSKLIFGNDLRPLFKLKDIWYHQTVLTYLDKIDQIKEVFYTYNQKSLAEIMLFEIAKRFGIIYELLKKKSTSNEILQAVFGNKFHKIRHQVKKQRSWIALYDEKGKGGELGFGIFKFRKKRSSITIIPTEDNRFEKLVVEIKTLGKKCQELIQI